LVYFCQSAPVALAVQELAWKGQRIDATNALCLMAAIDRKGLKKSGIEVPNGMKFKGILTREVCADDAATFRR
jgi:hypothetical protein